MSRRKAERAPILGTLTSTAIVLAAGLAAYVNGFAAPFVFDDRGSIVENTHIRTLWPPGEALSAPPQSALAGRPAASASLAVNYALGGLAPWPYRAGNLVIHVLAALALLGIVRRAARSARTQLSDASASVLALACALLWLLHPLQTEVVDYITQRTESMMGVFYFLTLYASIRGMQSARPSLKWTLVAVTACAAGMASKESMVTAPVMVLLYDATFEAGSIRGAVRARARLYAGLAATWILLAVLVAPGPRSHSAGLSSGVTPWVYALNQPNMIVTYLRQACWPTALILDYGPTNPVSMSSALPSAALVVALLVATTAAWWKYPTIGFLGTWFFVTLAPSSSFVPIATEVGAERRMYLPLASLVVMAVVLARALWLSARMANSRYRWVPATLLVLVCSGLSWLTVRRNAEYLNEAELWQTVVARHPHGRARYQLGIALAEEGRRNEAIAQYRAAVADCPDAHYALGFELEADGKHDEAISHVQEYVRLRPDDLNVIRANILLGRALLEAGRPLEAVDALRRALAMKSGDADAHGLLADALLRLERYPEAAREYRERLTLTPRDAVAHESLGIALVGQSRESEAIAEFASAVELAPRDPHARYDLGNALAGVGRLDEAAHAYQDALALAPNSVATHNALALVLAARDDSAAAVAQYQRSLELDPRNPETRSAYAALLRRLGRRAEADRVEKAPDR
jgi:protein O-mannosyl-transferase